MKREHTLAQQLTCVLLVLILIMASERIMEVKHEREVDYDFFFIINIIIFFMHESMKQRRKKKNGNKRNIERERCHF